MKQGHWITLCLFLIVFVAAASVLVAITAERSLKNEINAVYRTQCITGSRATGAIFARYDDFVESFIQHEKVSERKDRQDGLKSNATNDASLVARLKADRLPVIHQDCSTPYLR